MTRAGLALARATAETPRGALKAEGAGEGLPGRDVPNSDLGTAPGWEPGRRGRAGETWLKRAGCVTEDDVRKPKMAREVLTSGHQ